MLICLIHVKYVTISLKYIFVCAVKKTELSHNSILEYVIVYYILKHFGTLFRHEE